MTAVAKAANVDAIVPGVLYKQERTQIVDVTPAILDELGTNQKTRDMIKSLPAKIEMDHEH